MHYTFQLPEILVQNSLSVPTQVFQECWSGVQPPPPPPPPPMNIWADLGTLSLSWSGVPPSSKNENLGRSWHFELVWSTLPSKNDNLGRSWHFEFESGVHPPSKNDNLGRSWDFGFELVWSTPPPPLKFQGVRMWRLISVSPVDTIAFLMLVRKRTPLTLLKRLRLFCLSVEVSLVTT